MVDLDNFKEINDRFGHHTGDEVLCRMPTLIKRFLRGGDVVVRFGGEEFVILLPATNSAQAKVPLERIRSQVAAEEVLPQAVSHRPDENQKRQLLTESMENRLIIK